MLVPIQTQGSKPPLFFVHGMHGVMPVGHIFSRALGPDQPFYALNAKGMDGRAAPLDEVPDMVLAYVGEIQRVRPEGKIRIGGMCWGCLIAIEIARKFGEMHRPVGPVILADPPLTPGKLRQIKDPRQPHVARQLYEQVRTALLAHASRPYNEMPFDPEDAEQLHAATLAGVGSAVAFGRYSPDPFPGPTQLIVSAEWAPSFFHPQMPWQKLLPGPRTVHVLPWHHMQLFRAGREPVARLLRYLLEETSTLEAFAERATKSTAAAAPVAHDGTGASSAVSALPL